MSRLFGSKARVVRPLNALLLTLVWTGCLSFSLQAQHVTRIHPLFFSKTQGGADPLPQILTVPAPASDSSFAVSAATSSGGDWLAVTGSDGTPAPVTVAVKPNALIAGTYSGHITVVANGVPVVTRVTLVVTPPDQPALVGTQSQLSFALKAGGRSAPRLLEIRDSGDGPLNWQLAGNTFNGAEFLRFSSTSGHGRTRVSVEVVPENLPDGGKAEGVYTGQILLVSGSSAVTVPVSVSVGQTEFDQAEPVYFEYGPGSGPLSKLVRLRSTGAEFRFRASAATISGGDWLKVDSGDVSTSEEMRIEANPAGLTPGTYSGQIIARNLRRATVVPVTLTVAPVVRATATSNPPNLAPPNTMNCACGGFNNQDTGYGAFTTAPDGTNTGQLVFEANPGNGAVTHYEYIFNDLVQLTGSGGDFTLSFHFKAAQNSWVYITSTVDGSSAKRVWFNLANGTVGSIVPAFWANAQITPAANGWYRASVTFHANNGAIFNGFGLATADQQFAYTATIGNGVYEWGQQFESGQLSAYSANTGPCLSLDVQRDASPVPAGTSIGYTISVANSAAQGTGAATSAVLNDPLPAAPGMNWSMSSGPGTCSISGNTGNQNLTCNFGTLSGGDTAMAHIVSPTTGASCGTWTNTATLTASNANPISRGSAVVVDCSVPTVGLVIAKSHAGNFTQGQAGVTYSLVVSNNGTLASAGLVTVTDTLPAGLTMVSMQGTGWACASGGGNNCTRSDALAPGNSYPSITVTVNVAANAPASVINQAGVSGGSSASSSANDVTTINPSGGGGGGTNIAVGKPATQSSTYAGAAAGRAVDGNTDGVFGDASLSTTNPDANAWWQIDLGTGATVNSVTVWNRTDCCGSRLGDYWVFVSNTPFLPTDTPATLQARAGTFASHQTLTPNPAISINVGGMAGQYVRVQLSGTDYLSLAEVQIFGVAGNSGSNIAAGKPATQSSTYAGAAAGRAVDGNTDGVFGDGSLSTTNPDANAWWQVDLGTGATVNSVTVWNRTDCCGTRLGDFWVFVSNTPFLPTDTPATLQARAGTFASHQTLAPSPSTSINVGGMAGQFVRVQLSGTDYLSLAEVQVFGTAGNSGTNIALGKLAAQSSTYAGASASRAIDGNTDGVFGDGSLSTTNPDANAWWQVDLGASSTVNSVSVWNRTDCCGSRLSDYWVFISNTPFLASDTPATLQGRPGTYANHQTTAPGPNSVIATGGVSGQYVRIQLSVTDYLSLAEVQVFGIAGSNTDTNLAQGKAATQSSTYAAAVAARAVDGNTDGIFGDNSLSTTNSEANAWWQVDLGLSKTVDTVVVWNRTDCCGDRLGDYWVFVSNTPFLNTDTPATLSVRAGTFANHQTSAPSPNTPVATGGFSGRYVRIQLGGTNFLSLGEVQVMGH